MFPNHHSLVFSSFWLYFLSLTPLAWLENKTFHSLVLLCLPWFDWVLGTAKSMPQSQLINFTLLSIQVCSCCCHLHSLFSWRPWINHLPYLLENHMWILNTHPSLLFVSVFFFCKELIDWMPRNLSFLSLHLSSHLLLFVWTGFLSFIFLYCSHYPLMHTQCQNLIK